MKRKIQEETVNFYAKVSEGRGLTRPAIGVGSLLIFFTRPGFMELSNLATSTQGRHRPRTLIKHNKHHHQAFKFVSVICSAQYFKWWPGTSRELTAGNRDQKYVKLSVCVCRKKEGERNISEGPTVASGRLIMTQILNQSWESLLLLPPTGSC